MERENSEAFLLFQTMLSIMKTSFTTQRKKWTKGGPQQSLAKAPHQPTRTVRAALVTLCD